MSATVAMVQLHWLHHGGGSKGRTVPHWKENCEHCPRRIIVKGYVYARIDSAHCYGLMELTTDATLELARQLSARSEDLRGMQLILTRPKGGRNGKVIPIVGERMFDPLSTDSAHPVRDPEKILLAKWGNYVNPLEGPHDEGGFA